MNRVLHLIKGLGRGGAEQILVNAAPYLDTARFAYEVAYLLPWKDALAEDLREAGMAVHCLEGARGIGWLGRLRALVRERRIDLLHVHSPYAAIGARIAFRRGTLPLVYTEHGVWKRYRALTYWGNVVTFPRNDHIFAVSEHVRASLRYPRGLRFLSMAPVETLYHGIDPAVFDDAPAADGIREELGLPDGVPVVGTVANFRGLKGHSYLLRAAAEVRRAIPEVRFVLVGQGPLEQEVRREATRMRLDGTVIFTGFRQDVPRIVRTFDAFVLPSLYEGLSIALIEAMSLGKPAVVTGVGGLTEVVEHWEQGLVVPAADHRALAEAIVTLLRDPALLARLGERARRRATDFDIRKAVRRIEEVYGELLS